MKVLNEIKIENLLSESEIQQCKEYLKTATEQHKVHFVSVFAELLFTRIYSVDQSLDMQQKVFGRLCISLAEFFDINLPNKPQMK